MSVHFDDSSKISPNLDRQNEKTKYKRIIFAQEDHENFVALQIDSQEKFMNDIDKDSDKVLSMILDIQKIYTESLDKANKADNQCNKIEMHVLELE